MSKRNIHLYLEDINTSVGKIKKFTKGMSYDKFEADDRTVDAVIRNIEVLGEAVRNIPKEVRGKYPNIPWSKIISTRNKVIHEYFGVDKEILWRTVKKDIPVIAKQIKDIIKDYK